MQVPSAGHLVSFQVQVQDLLHPLQQISGSSPCTTADAPAAHLQLVPDTVTCSPLRTLLSPQLGRDLLKTSLSLPLVSQVPRAVTGT